MLKVNCRHFPFSCILYWKLEFKLLHVFCLLVFAVSEHKIHIKAYNFLCWNRYSILKLQPSNLQSGVQSSQLDARARLYLTISLTMLSLPKRIINNFTATFTIKIKFFFFIFLLEDLKYSIMPSLRHHELVGIVCYSFELYWIRKIMKIITTFIQGRPLSGNPLITGKVDRNTYLFMIRMLNKHQLTIRY